MMRGKEGRGRIEVVRSWSAVSRGPMGCISSSVTMLNLVERDEIDLEVGWTSWGVALDYVINDRHLPSISLDLPSPAHLTLETHRRLVHPLTSSLRALIYNSLRHSNPYAQHRTQTIVPNLPPPQLSPTPGVAMFPGSPFSNNHRPTIRPPSTSSSTTSSFNPATTHPASLFPRSRTNGSSSSSVGLGGPQRRVHVTLARGSGLGNQSLSPIPTQATPQALPHSQAHPQPHPQTQSISPAQCSKEYIWVNQWQSHSQSHPTQTAQMNLKKEHWHPAALPRGHNPRSQPGAEGMRSTAGGQNQPDRAGGGGGGAVGARGSKL